MPKRLIRVGGCHAIVLDQGVLETAGIDGDTLLDVSTDGSAILIRPVRSDDRRAKLKCGLNRTHERYADAFRRLASGSGD